MAKTSGHNICTHQCIVTEKEYKKYFPAIAAYIARRIKHRHEAEDIAQDVFVRILEQHPAVLSESTFKSLLFTIARNLVTDHIRRYYRKDEYMCYAFYCAVSVDDTTESGIIADDILREEKRILVSLPHQRKQVYSMSRFEEKSTPEIAVELRLSKRTVENHLLLAREAVRTHIRQCI